MSKSTPPASKCTGTTEPHPEEQRARELVRGCFFIGVDGHEAAHFWSPVEQTVAVIEGDAAETVALADTPFSTLREWVEYTRAERGWDVGPRVGGSLVDDLRRGLDR